MRFQLLLLRLVRRRASVNYSTIREHDDIGTGKRTMTLAKNLASVMDESCSSDEKRPPQNWLEMKRSIELRIKKRVREQYVNGKFQNLMEKVIACPDTLQDSYNSIRLSSKVDISVNDDILPFEIIADELRSGEFDVGGNTFLVSAKGVNKEVLVLPNLKLKVVQEAIRIVLDLVYRPLFSKISHGGRSGRGHSSALKYICKEVTDSDWWFTVVLDKKLDSFVFEKMVSAMEDKIDDPGLCEIIRGMFDSQVLNMEFGGFPKGHGLPQEGVLSPILMNIYLDNFDHEFYRLSMKYEALNTGSNAIKDGSQPKLRSWFRRQVKDYVVDKAVGESVGGTRVHCCRFMDEMFFAVSGTKEAAVAFKSDAVNYLQDSLCLNVDHQEEILPCNGSNSIRFLGTLIRRNVKETAAVKAVHKLKDKVKLFALDKHEAWNAGTVRIGKKWLAHGLKKVKESEITHLADSNSTLNKISNFRKAGMLTDHWYKLLLQVWMQDVNSKESETSADLLSKHIAEPALPQELTDSFYEFQNRAEEYISSETAATLALLQNATPSTKPVTKTEIVAPVNTIQKRLSRYGLITSSGHPRSNPHLILQDSTQIINWYSGIVHRWLKWYSKFNNFNDINLMIYNQVRKSCIRTLAAKYRIHEDIIEKRFSSELSRIPFTDETSDPQVFNSDDEGLKYGVYYSGVCLLSLARVTSRSRPCKCFVTGCSDAAPGVYTVHVMERQRFPGWKTGFSSCIHPSLNKKRIGLCNQHLEDLYLGHISLQSIDFGAWNVNKTI